MTAQEVELRRVWSLPLRLFHWGLVISVGVGWYLGEFGPFDKSWHFYLGYATGGLILFRLALGVFGGPAARLGALFPRPADLIAYIRHMFSRTPSYWPGHNPVGALSVLAMLLALSVQVITGLFAYDDTFFQGGPLAEYASAAWRNRATGLHHLFSKIILALVALHIGAVLFYLLWKGENLIRPMLTGLKPVRKPK